MNTKIKLLGIVLVGVLITFWVSQKNEIGHDILLNNVEALASTESSSYECWGYGSLDCPMGTVKVYKILYKSR